MHIQEFWKSKLQVLDKRIKAFPQGYRQNVAILGNDSEEIGYLLDNYFGLNRLNDIVYIRISTNHVSRKSFFKGVAFSILSEYIKKEDTLDNLINYTQQLLPSTVDFAKEMLKRTNSPSFLDILELINKFINETSKKCVFIIEDFLALKNFFPNFHQDFSKFIILQNNCMVVLVDINSRESQKSLYFDLNFLFGNFEKIILDESNFLNSYVCLKNLFSGFSCSPFFVSFFTNILGANTIYHNIIREALSDSYKNDDEIGSVVSILEKTLYTKETYLFQKFMKKITFLEENFRDYSGLSMLLMSISEGYIREAELASLRIFDQKNLRVKLQKLCDLNYIEDLGDVYKIKDPLFSFWVSHFFKTSFHVPVFDAQKRLRLLRAKAKESIIFFKDDFYKEKIKKILELFSVFKNDSLKLGKDKYRLPQVEKSRLVSYPQSNTHFLIGEGREVIFVAIKEGTVDDCDVFDFIEKGSAIKGKNVRKIFVSLDTFTSSAKLIAKNNRFVTWDINEVNDLCRAYNKPIFSLIEETTRA